MIIKDGQIKFSDGTTVEVTGNMVGLDEHGHIFVGQGKKLVEPDLTPEETAQLKNHMLYLWAKVGLK